MRELLPDNPERDDYPLTPQGFGWPCKLLWTTLKTGVGVKIFKTATPQPPTLKTQTPEIVNVKQ